MTDVTATIAFLKEQAPGRLKLKIAEPFLVLAATALAETHTLQDLEQMLATGDIVVHPELGDIEIFIFGGTMQIADRGDRGLILSYTISVGTVFVARPYGDNFGYHSPHPGTEIDRRLRNTNPEDEAVDRRPAVLTPEAAAIRLIADLALQQTGRAGALSKI